MLVQVGHRELQALFFLCSNCNMGLTDWDYFLLDFRLGEITLGDFKEAIDRPGMFRYHFKALDPEFGTVKEEVCTCSHLNYLNCFSSSETHGQIVGARKSLNGWKNMAQRKVKNGEKSPWGQCLTRPVPNGRRHSGFWLVPENFVFEIKNNYNISNMNWTSSFLDPSVQYFSGFTWNVFC